MRGDDANVQLATYQVGQVPRRVGARERAIANKVQ
jgi:hypothetical protein